MDDNHFLDNDMMNVQGERPTFVTVLTIFTFVISGIMLLSSLYSFISYDEIATQKGIDDVVVMYAEKGMDANIIDAVELFGTESIENHNLFSIISILSCLLSLFGAYMMYNMKKLGFHLYVTSKIIGLIPIAILTSSIIVGAYYGFLGFLTLAFIIMYGVNLKHFKN